MNDNSRTPTPNNPTGRVLHDLARRDVPDDRDLRADVLGAIEQRRTAPEQPRSWTGPVIDPASRRRAQPPTTPDAEEYTAMSSASDATREPIPIRQRRWAREALLIAASAVVFITIGAILALALRDGDDEPTVAVPLPTPTPSIAPTATVMAVAATTTPATRPSPTSAAVATATVVAPTPTPISVLTSLPEMEGCIGGGEGAAGYGVLWTLCLNRGVVLRSDPETLEPLAPIDTGFNGGQYSGIGLERPVAGEGAFWAPAHGADGVEAIVRIDPATDAVTVIPLDVRPYAVGAGQGAVWVTSLTSNVVLRIDPTTHEVLARVEMRAPEAIVVGDEGVWVFSSGTGLVRIDPATNAVIATVELPSGGLFFAIGEGAVWVSVTNDNHILRIDPATNAVAATIQVAEPVTIAAGGGGLFVNRLGLAGVVERIDPTTLEVVASYRAGYLDKLFYGDGSIWAYNIMTGEINRIDP